MNQLVIEIQKKKVENNIIKHQLNNIILVKGDFNETVKVWNRNIDILFIDGSHDYESVKSDFYNWSKYLDDEGVILMHDTNVQDFGVRKLFLEIKGYYKFEFPHSAGLGIITKNKIVKILIDNMYANDVISYQESCLNNRCSE